MQNYVGLWSAKTGGGRRYRGQITWSKLIWGGSAQHPLAPASQPALGSANVPLAERGRRGGQAWRPENARDDLVFLEPMEQEGEQLRGVEV